MAVSDLKLALKLKLRRKYANDLVGLKALSESVFAETTDVVTITQQSMEGGQSAGQITCPRDTLLLAIEEIIQELDTSAPRPSAYSLACFK